MSAAGAADYRHARCFLATVCLSPCPYGTFPLLSCHFPPVPYVRTNVKVRFFDARKPFYLLSAKSSFRWDYIPQTVKYILNYTLLL